MENETLSFAAMRVFRIIPNENKLTQRSVRRTSPAAVLDAGQLVLIAHDD
jgi:hypothetical protein